MVQRVCWVVLEIIVGVLPFVMWTWSWVVCSKILHQYILKRIRPIWFLPAVKLWTSIISRVIFWSVTTLVTNIVFVNFETGNFLEVQDDWFVASMSYHVNCFWIKGAFFINPVSIRCWFTKVRVLHSFTLNCYQIGWARSSTWVFEILFLDNWIFAVVSDERILAWASCKTIEWKIQLIWVKSFTLSFCFFHTVWFTLRWCILQIVRYS